MQGIRGEDLGNAIRYQTARHIRLASLVEQPPDPDDRVTLSAGLESAIHAMAVPLALRGDFTRRPLQLHQGF
jgi:hypothetical protein